MIRVGLTIFYKLQSVKPKPQTSTKTQISNLIDPARIGLVIGNWDFFGIWSLGFMVSRINARVWFGRNDPSKAGRMEFRSYSKQIRLLVVRSQTIAAARAPALAPLGAPSMKDTTTGKRLLSSQMSILQ